MIRLSYLILGFQVGKKMSKMTKRLLYMFSFFSFKLKLKYKCETYNKKLVIVDESFTSKTCGNCGCLNDVGGSEWYTCDKGCRMEIDRDVNGARNILLKNITKCVR
jgi:transposase